MTNILINSSVQKLTSSIEKCNVADPHNLALDPDPAWIWPIFENDLDVLLRWCFDPGCLKIPDPTEPDLYPQLQLCTLAHLICIPNYNCARWHIFQFVSLKETNCVDYREVTAPNNCVVEPGPFGDSRPERSYICQIEGESAQKRHPETVQKQRRFFQGLFWFGAGE